MCSPSPCVLIKKYLENLSNAEIFVENKNKLVNLCREVDILDRLQNNNKLISISLTQKNNNVKEYSLSNANEDIAPVRSDNVYGEDIKMQTASAEDIAPIGENVVRKTTESENTIIDGDEPIQEIQSMEKTKSTTHEDLVKQMSDIMDEATEYNTEEPSPCVLNTTQKNRPLVFFPLCSSCVLKEPSPCVNVIIVRFYNDNIENINTV